MRKTRLSLLAIFYLPGTILHELSHYLFAKILFVPVGQFNIIPKFVEGGFILGSVQIAKTDFVRRFIIGVAPFFVGLIIIAIASYVFIFTTITPLVRVALGYIILCVINTMWLSPSDLKGAWKVPLILVIALGLFFVLH